MTIYDLTVNHSGKVFPRDDEYFIITYGDSSYYEDHPKLKFILQYPLKIAVDMTNKLN